MTITDAPHSGADLNEQDLDAAAVVRSGRGALMQGIRHRRYPLVPPALAAAVTAYDKLDDLIGAVGREPVENMARFVHRVSADVLAGRGLPADFAVGAYAATLAADRQAATANGLQGVRRAVETRFEHVVTEHLDELLDGLRGEMDEILSEVRKRDAALGALDVADPRAVAAASDEQRSALLGLEACRRRYNVVRVAQRDALRASTIRPPGAGSWVRTWDDSFAAGEHELRRGSAGLSDSNDVARLRAVARRDDVWLPSVADLAKLGAELAQRQSAMSGASW